MTTQPHGVTLSKVEAALGARVSGIDLSEEQTPAVRRWIRDAVLTHGVLVFKNQTLTAHQFHEFASSFGPLQVHVLRKYRHEDYPGLSWLTNVAADGSVDPFGVTRATDWHTDGSFTDNPPSIGILHAHKVPTLGAGTLFTSMSGALEALPDATRKQLAALNGLHRHGAGPGGDMYDDALDEDQNENHHDARHSVIRPHPATGRSVLYVNSTHTRTIAELPHEDAVSLIRELVTDATREELVYNHQWQPGDLLMWDEHGTMHRGEGAYDPQEPRVMLRAIVQSYASDL